MTAFTETVQAPNPGALITLFCLDTTSIGGTKDFFAPASQANAGITFQGQFYTPVDVDFTGMEVSNAGALPQPKIKLSNSNKVFQAVVNTYGDLVGCTVSRIRTFAQFLDGQPGADPTAFRGPDIFRVERKSSENPVFIEWELSASIDNQGAMIPARVVVRDTCIWRYRQWVPTPTPGAFDYSKAQCPYTGDTMFTVTDGTTTDPTQDDCGRTVPSCNLHFPGEPLPYGGFPGVARFQ